MKKIFLILIIYSTSVSVFSQAISEKLIIHDTRYTNDSPSFNSQYIRADFKIRQTIGVPGIGDYSTNFTISPWYDPSGGLHHQLNFNDGGIFYRNGRQDSPSWNRWKKIMVADENNNVEFGHNAQISAVLHDNLNFQNISFGHYAIGWMSDPWNISGSTLWMSGYGGIRFFSSGTLAMSINYAGNVGIGTGNPQSKLDVAGTIRAREVKVEVTAGADHVFAEDYDLKPLSEVEAFVLENRHLPEIPSEKQMQEEGLNVNEFQIKLLQKIEELTLYIVEQQKDINYLKDKIKILETNSNNK